ncbi:MAG TPA: glycogen/starch synthase [Dysgonamonadaceae bacterium]|nr:glycogen/starch synthase [Dysgonamonadaceae bacterium]
MHTNLEYSPHYIFESSWEVCNKVGGIYTVLSSRANTLQKEHKDKIIFIGPDIWKDDESPWFKEDESLHKKWREYADLNEDLSVRIGRWDVPGEPIAILVNFEKFYEHKNDIYGQMWRLFGVDSMPSYGDYDDSSMFGYAVGNVIESFYKFHQLQNKHVVAHFNEWMLGMGALYVKHFVPKIATIFTTHATSIGRSIAGNNLPLYKYFNNYNGDQMAQELNMVSKHSVEKTAAHNVDCFTTVSDTTARECVQLLEKEPHVVTPNGFEKGFIPKKGTYTKQRNKARKTLTRVAEALMGHSVAPESLFVALSGRYEYKNKGIDVFIDALNKLRNNPSLKKDIVAFVMVPAWVKEYRSDLQQRLQDKDPQSDITALPFPFVTHDLHEPENDPLLSQIKALGFTNSKEEKVSIIFVPSYLNGDDGIFNTSYYDLLIGLDATVFPSYYEPWGYTPHESIAFSIPTVTTSLAGFGAWATKQGDVEGIDDGVEVIKRDEDNSDEVSTKIAEALISLSQKTKKEIKETRDAALKLADSADWEHFIVHYEEAYCKALHNSIERLSAKNSNNE